MSDVCHLVPLSIQALAAGAALVCVGCRHKPHIDRPSGGPGESDGRCSGSGAVAPVLCGVSAVFSRAIFDDRTKKPWLSALSLEKIGCDPPAAASPPSTHPSRMIYCEISSLEAQGTLSTAERSWLVPS